MFDRMSRVPQPTVRGRRARTWLGLAVALWLVVIVSGLGTMWVYAKTPGQADSAPERWPAAAQWSHDNGRPTLLLFLHPHCTCSRATLRQLTSLLGRLQQRPAVQLVVYTPREHTAEWTNSDVMTLARAIPDARLVSDIDGAVARLFGVRVSGDVLLYDLAGQLRFAGGLTDARGHEGDSVGAETVYALLERHEPRDARTHVYGCLLHGAEERP